MLWNTQTTDSLAKGLLGPLTRSSARMKMMCGLSATVDWPIDTATKPTSNINNSNNCRGAPPHPHSPANASLPALTVGGCKRLICIVFSVNCNMQRGIMRCYD